MILLRAAFLMCSVRSRLSEVLASEANSFVFVKTMYIIHYKSVLISYNFQMTNSERCYTRYKTVEKMMFMHKKVFALRISVGEKHRWQRNGVSGILIFFWIPRQLKEHRSNRLGG